MATLDIKWSSAIGLILLAIAIFIIVMIFFTVFSRQAETQLNIPYVL